MKLRSLIVDDEPIARDILKNYCSHIPEIEVVASCRNALEAKKVMLTTTVDIVFLDINMPVLDGLSFMRTLSPQPAVIFTTAYKEFAHVAYDQSACDYLLKPFSLERFIIAINKAKEWKTNKSTTLQGYQSSNSTFIKTEGKVFRINFDEVRLAEANGNYVKIITDTGSLRPSITLTALEEILPGPKFIRVHRSFIVNKDKIEHIEGNRVFISSIKIPIGANYKEIFFRELGLK